ncbi:fimbrial biogenesis chaperone [Rhodanobacter umsongensis]
MFRISLGHWVACGLVSFSTVVATASAGSFQVNPVRATLSNTQHVVALTVRNTGPDPAVIQLEALAWSQAQGTDTYGPAPEILATPPIFTIAAGASQVIRVGSRKPPDANVERAYRLFVREVPPPRKPDFKGLQMALQISLPIFVIPAKPIKPDLRWRASRLTSGELEIDLANKGLRHARLTHFRLTAADSSRLLPMSALAVYVLPGAEHAWMVTAGSSASLGSKLHLSADSEAGPIEADLVIVRG